MDVNKLTPLQAIVIFGLFMGMLMFWHWADSRALDYMGPVHLHTDRNGSLFIQLGNHLLEHNANGSFVAEHDLTRLGLEKFQGDFAFFNNGDILLAKRETPPDFEENISAYKRDTNQRPVESGNNGDGLFRCSLKTYSCEHFGDKTLDFGRAFHLYISPEDEAVYVSDSSRHTLRKYSKDGKELASRDSGFIFPNQILMHEERLYITNTNNHSIQVVLPDTEQFAKGIEIFDVRDSGNKTRSTKWPSSILKAGKYWWINNMDSGMAYGSIDLYDEDWKYQKSLELPEDADPQDIILFNGNVLISDFSLHRIYQFDQNGEALHDFRSLELDQILDTQIKQHNYYNNLQSAVLTVFYLSLAAGLLFGLKAIWFSIRITEPVNSQSQFVNIENPEINWLKPSRKLQQTKKTLFFFATITTLLVIITIAGLAIMHTIAASLVIIGLGSVVSLWFAFFHYRSIANSRIGALKDLLILKDYQGLHTAGIGEQIYYSDDFLLIGNIAVSLGSGKNKFFPHKELVQQIYPLMKEAIYLENQQMYVLLLKRKNPYVITYLSGIGILIAGFIVLVILS